MSKSKNVKTGETQKCENGQTHKNVKTVKVQKGENTQNAKMWNNQSANL